MTNPTSTRFDPPTVDELISRLSAAKQQVALWRQEHSDMVDIANSKEEFIKSLISQIQSAINLSDKFGVIGMVGSEAWLSQMDKKLTNAELYDNLYASVDSFMPIDTAPKDGTRIVTMVNGYKPTVGWFENGEWLNERLKLDRENGEAVRASYKPTHWTKIII